MFLVVELVLDCPFLIAHLVFSNIFLLCPFCSMIPIFYYYVSYLTVFQCSLGRSFKTGLTVVYKLKPCV